MAFGSGIMYGTGLGSYNPYSGLAQQQMSNQISNATMIFDFSTNTFVDTFGNHYDKYGHRVNIASSLTLPTEQSVSKKVKTPTHQRLLATRRKKNGT